MPDIDMQGTKQDKGKTPWHLMPFDALNSVVDVLDYGQNKYAARNWERGMSWSRFFSAAIRHLIAWWGGEREDRETGLPHLAHAACCILFLLSYELRKMEGDDRP